MNLKTQEPVEQSAYIVYRYLFDSETLFAFVTILCIAMSVMLSLFTLYHIWLASTSVTTNERYKSAGHLNYFDDKLELLSDWKKSYETFEVSLELQKSF